MDIYLRRYEESPCATFQSRGGQPFPFHAEGRIYPYFRNPPGVARNMSTFFSGKYQNCPRQPSLKQTNKQTNTRGSDVIRRCVQIL